MLETDIDLAADERFRRFAGLEDGEVATLAHQSEDAVEYLMIKYKNLVRRKVRAYFIVGADNDDLVQEGMIGLYKGICDYKIDTNVPFAVFADICVTRHIITVIKAATRLKHTPLNTSVSLNKPVFDDAGDAVIEDMMQGEAGGPSPEEVFIDKEDFETMSSRINGALTDYEKSVLKLYLEGRTYNEIALSLGRRIKSVDNALQRAKIKIENIKKAQ